MLEKHLCKVNARTVKFLMTGTKRISCYKALTWCDCIHQNAFNPLYEPESHSGSVQALYKIIPNMRLVLDFVCTMPISMTHTDSDNLRNLTTNTLEIT
jgi:hypothetical protein